VKFIYLPRGPNLVVVGDVLTPDRDRLAISVLRSERKSIRDSGRSCRSRPPPKHDRFYATCRTVVWRQRRTQPTSVTSTEGSGITNAI